MARSNLSRCAYPRHLADPVHMQGRTGSIEEIAQHLAIELALTPRAKLKRGTLKAAACALMILRDRSLAPVRRRGDAA